MIKKLKYEVIEDSFRKVLYHELRSLFSLLLYDAHRVIRYVN